MTIPWPAWLPAHAEPLPSHGPLPTALPFTPRTAAQLGVDRPLLRELARRASIRQVLHGVWVSSAAPDSLGLRIAAVALVVPTHGVVADRSAAWLHGVPILPRTARTEIPPISVRQRPGTRMRRGGVEGGERLLLERDVMECGPVLVTTPLRTACDLGRSLWRFDALAALDGFLRVGLSHSALLAEVERFKGYRGVVQLRLLAPLADGRAESPGESALRLHWHDAGLPRPELQWWVVDDFGRRLYRLDIALPDIGYCAEYDGEEFHSAASDLAADGHRRGWLSSARNWHIEVFTKHDVYDPAVDPCPRLRAGFESASTRPFRTPVLPS